MTSETAVQQHARLTLANLGALPMRNNVGTAQDDTGRVIRYGLMNDSAKLNEQFKSSDLVAPVPITVTVDMVGRTIAAFGVFECKHSEWHLTPGDKRGQAQLRFINLVCSVGGLGGFVTDPADVTRIIEAFKRGY